MSYARSTNPSAIKYHAKTEQDWLLGLTILEELVKINGIGSAGMSCSAIAAAVGCSETAVQNVEYEAMRKIRLRLGHLKTELQETTIQRISKQPKKIKVRSRAVA